MSQSGGGPISLKLKLSGSAPLPRPPPRKGPLPHGVADDFITAPRPLVPPRPLSIPPRPLPKTQADVNEDFSKAKPSTQTPFSTFSNTLDPYLRNFAEDDLAFLATKTDDITPFIVPPLGRHYTETWADEDAMTGYPGSTAAPTFRQNSAAALDFPALQPTRPEALSDEYLVTERVHLGPLTERLMAALSLPHLSATFAAANEATGDGEPVDPPTGPSMDSIELEDRIKRELRYLGAFPPTAPAPTASGSRAAEKLAALGTGADVDWSQRTDDDVSAALRACQRQLREQMSINEARKSKLMQVTRDRLARQEYEQLRDALEKQIESGYIRRQRSQVNKQQIAAKNKAHPTVPATDTAANGVSPQKSAVPEALMAVLEKRRRLIDSVKPLFDGPDASRFVGIPQSSIYADNPLTRYDPREVIDHHSRARSETGRDDSVAPL